MAHDLETRQRFLELRSQGCSYDKIAQELHVAIRKEDEAFTLAFNINPDDPCFDLNQAPPGTKTAPELHQIQPDPLPKSTVGTENLPSV